MTASSTLTYADYARRGFFELAIVAALVLPLLLLFDWLARRDVRRGRSDMEGRRETGRRLKPPAPPRRIPPLFRPLAGALVVLLFAIMPRRSSGCASTRRPTA